MCADILYEEGQYEDALKIVQENKPVSNLHMDESFGNQEQDIVETDPEMSHENFTNAVNQGCIYYQMSNFQMALQKFSEAR